MHAAQGDWPVKPKLPLVPGHEGTWQDMDEALEFYARGQIKPTFHTRPLEDVNAVFDEMKHGRSTAAWSSTMRSSAGPGVR